MSIVRKSLTVLSAVAMLASASVASAQSIRPSDSLVSPSAVSAVKEVRKDAQLGDANHAIKGTTWVLVFIVIGTVVTAIWIAIDSDDEPESP